MIEAESWPSIVSASSDDTDARVVSRDAFPPLRSVSKIYEVLKESLKPGRNPHRHVHHQVRRLRS